MYEKVLVSLDGSELAEAALPYVRELSEVLGSELHMLGVCDDPRLPERLMQAYVDRLASQYVRAGLKAKAVVLCGMAENVIVSYAEENGISLVAMATHGRSGISRWILGSVVDKVIHASPVPLFIINAKLAKEGRVARRAFRRLLLPLDGSEVGEAALPFTEELARKTNARLLLLTVTPPAYRLAAFESYPAVDLEAIVQAQRQFAEAYLKGVEARLKEKGIAVSSEVQVGRGPDTILDYARSQKVDLISMSTHGRGGVSRWVLGSVTDKVVRAAETPVLLVRASGQPAGLV